MIRPLHQQNTILLVISQLYKRNAEIKISLKSKLSDIEKKG